VTEYPEEQIRKFRLEYVKRRKRRNLSLVPFFVFAAIALVSLFTSGGFLGIPFSVAGPVAYVTLLALIVFRIIDWRCPKCNHILSLDSNPKYCHKCGFELH
jgi:hypothetical protein